MSDGIKVHVVGTGTIGEPLSALLMRARHELGIDRVSISKRTPTGRDTEKINRLVDRVGVKFAAPQRKISAFENCGQPVHLTLEQAISEADVVVDCTSAGGGLENKENLYSKHEDDTTGFLAQGSEKGFGKPYARGINDRALVHGRDKYVQIVSCNTHSVCSLIKAIAFIGDECNLVHGHFVCIRRANDVSQDGGFIPAPQVGGHKHGRFGTHHAEDAWGVFDTLGLDLNIFSTAMVVNSQYMHIVQFSLQLSESRKQSEIIDLLEASPRVATTDLISTNSVFSVGRDWGHFGRLFSYVVVPHKTIWVSEDGHHVEGYAFTPQDGNSLFSSVAGIMWLVDPETYEKKLDVLRQYLLRRI